MCRLLSMVDQVSDAAAVSESRYNVVKVNFCSGGPGFDSREPFEIFFQKNTSNPAASTPYLPAAFAIKDFQRQRILDPTKHFIFRLDWWCEGVGPESLRITMTRSVPGNTGLPGFRRTPDSRPYETVISTYTQPLDFLLNPRNQANKKNVCGAGAWDAEGKLISDPETHFYAGETADGLPICKPKVFTHSTITNITVSDGIIPNIECAENMVMTGVTARGTPICKKLKEECNMPGYVERVSDSGEAECLPMISDKCYWVGPGGGKTSTNIHDIYKNVDPGNQDSCFCPKGSAQVGFDLAMEPSGVMTGCHCCDLN